MGGGSGAGRFSGTKGSNPPSLEGSSKPAVNENSGASFSPSAGKTGRNVIRESGLAITADLIRALNAVRIGRLSLRELIDFIGSLRPTELNTNVSGQLSGTLAVIDALDGLKQGDGALTDEQIEQYLFALEKNGDNAVISH